MRSLVLSCGVCLLLLPLFSPSSPALSAQVIEGRLMEAETRTPIPMGTVALLDTLMTELRQVTTDARGRFRLQTPGPGDYYVLANAMGYKRTLDGVLELGEGGRISVDFFLRPKPIGLDSLSVEAERQRISRHLELQGFTDRQAQGYGHFITPEEIERRNIRDYGRLFQRSPVEVVGGFGNTVLSIRGKCRRGVFPAVFVDAALVDLRWDRPAELKGALEEVVEVSDVLAVEVYTGPASTPIQWSGTSIKRTCGVIVIWTKSGEDSPPAPSPWPENGPRAR